MGVVAPGEKKSYRSTTVLTGWLLRERHLQRNKGKRYYFSIHRFETWNQWNQI